MNHRRLTCFMLALSVVSGCVHRSPGVLHEASTAELTPSQEALRDDLRADVTALSWGIGPRNAAESVEAVLAAERWIIGRLEDLGLDAERIEVSLGGVSVSNIEATFVGLERPDEIIVVGGHYDTHMGSPGANDNASGVAMLLATVGALRDEALSRTVRIVFFVNEESPFSGGVQMGSRVYAERCRAEGDDIVAMIAVDSVGCFSNEPGSQKYPIRIGGLPSTGNFIVFASNRENAILLDSTVARFQANCRFPSIGVAMDSSLVASSDHAPFWWQGYPAISMSDTSRARDPHYHRPTDVAGNLNYTEMARLAEGFARTVESMSNAASRP